MQINREGILQIVSKLALVALTLMPLVTVAQNASSPPKPGCIRQNSSRLLDSECDRTEEPPPILLLKKEIVLTTRITLPGIKSQECQAMVSIEYSQAGPVAKVKGTINNETCAASAGSFVIVAKIKDAANETKTLEFPQTWTREDDKGVDFSRDYDIGDNVYLSEMRVSKVQCKCVEQEKTGD